MTRGFIALISVILIAGFLLVVVTALSMRSFYARLGVLEREYKEQGTAYAYACVESLRLRMLSEPEYASGSEMQVAEGVCDVGVISDDSVVVMYHYKQTVTSLHVELENRRVLNVREIPSGL